MHTLSMVASTSAEKSCAKWKEKQWGESIKKFTLVVLQSTVY